MVISRPREGFTNSGFRGGTFGISINRVANFNTRFGYFSDIEGNSSIIDFFLADAQGIPENQIENRGLTGAAYQAFLINPIAFDNQGNPINNPTQYDSFVLGLPFQDEFVEQEGGITQTTFSYGANFGNKLFIGAGLGISSVNYLRTATFNEEFFGEPLTNLSIQENLRINGFGINLNAGIIYKPIDQVNLGFNFQSPTWYRLNEEYDGRIVAFYDNFFFEDEGIRLNREEGLTPFVISTFNLNTPMRLSAGGTFFVGKNGFITADVDYIDYSMNRLNSRDFNPSLDNQQINTLFGQAINFRLGGEFRYDIFRFRGGYGLYGDPFVNDDFDRTRQQFTGGLGVRLSKFYVDFAFISNNFRDLYTSYSFIEGGQELGAVAEVRNVINQGILTLGFNF
ncbi:OmpP1/FadL family transporter [Nitritalea halalkaliphila]|uniref:OmpP1/FadL family transporter n=1 Tax=Nitritalea halalkaliphila TaxID=590849 RepID=UPI0002EE25D3|nr:long-chain fatty acid transporter [Nitritalea halalkaliphila]